MKKLFSNAQKKTKKTNSGSNFYFFNSFFGKKKMLEEKKLSVPAQWHCTKNFHIYSGKVKMAKR
jgi:hypothetical protein